MSVHSIAKFAFFGLLAVISYLAFSPAPVQLDFNNMDKLNHLAAFASLACVGRAAFNLHLGWLLVLLTGYGAFIELIQAHIPNRFASGVDLLADMLGILLGLFCYRLLRPYLSKISWLSPLVKGH